MNRKTTFAQAALPEEDEFLVPPGQPGSMMDRLGKKVEDHSNIGTRSIALVLPIVADGDLLIVIRRFWP